MQVTQIAFEEFNDGLAELIDGEVDVEYDRRNINIIGARIAAGSGRYVKADPDLERRIIAYLDACPAFQAHLEEQIKDIEDGQREEAEAQRYQPMEA